jgi:hypothetical protein
VQQGAQVLSLKSEIQEKTGVPGEYMRVFASEGGALKDGDTVPQGELEVQFNLKGGKLAR